MKCPKILYNPKEDVLLAFHLPLYQIFNKDEKRIDCSYTNCFHITFAQGVDFGIKAGVNFANITDASIDNRTGFVAGIFWEENSTII